MEVQTINLSTIQPRKLSWLWQDRLPLAKMVMLAGDPGVGKSYFTTWLAARVTLADDFPDGKASLRKPGTVVFLSAEDDPRDTILPRCMKAGADLSRIEVVEGIERNDASEGFSLDRHLDALESMLKKLDRPRLVVIDPVSAYMGDADSNSNAQVRGVLKGVSELAHKYGPTVLCVSHLSKNTMGGSKAVYRTMGSLAFVAAARLAYYVSSVPAADGSDMGERAIAMVKNNIGPLMPTMTYRIKDGQFSWVSMASAITAEQLEKNVAWGEVPPTSTENATNWLREQLAAGALAVEELDVRAKKAKQGRRAIMEAKQALGVRSTKRGRVWYWELPADAAPESPAMWESQEHPGITTENPG